MMKGRETVAPPMVEQMRCGHAQLIARRRVGQVQPEDDLVLVVEAEALAGGLELCAARVLNDDLEASRPILIKLMIHAPPNAHGRRGRASPGSWSCRRLGGRSAKRSPRRHRCSR